jgi:isoquinoline 1-oxidoreductase subunit beta
MKMSKRPRRRLFSLSRRRLIAGGGLAGGALVVGYIAGPGTIASTILSMGAKEIEPSAFGPFIRIDAQGWVTVVNKHQEMGQGTHAGLAAMVAEELDADWNTIKIESAPANAAVYRGAAGMQATVGSNAINGSWNQLRHAGAAARAMFVQAAATRWRVPAASIHVQNGVVIHRASDRRASFADLLAEVARITPPSEPVLKDPRDFTLIGTDRVRRKDSQAKSTGAARYTQDQHLPRMLTAMVAHPPRFGSTVASVDATAARQIRGVADVFAIPSGVAVVASDTYTARRGREALKIVWNDEEAEKRSSKDLVDYYHRLAEGKGDVSPSVFHAAGDASHAFGGELFEASFDFPYLAHAAMEPMNCVARIDGWRVTLMSGSQLQTLDQINAARTLMTAPGMVEIETLPAGGSFGRRGILASDYVVECLNIARRVGDGVPVKLVWTREDDMAAGFYRPMAHHRVWIACGADGFPTAWRHHAVAQGLLPFGPNDAAVDGVKNSPYLSATPVVHGKVFTPAIGVPAGFWRSVGHSHTAMVMEHTIDQLARRARVDPAAYRRAIYKKAGDTRRLGVLDLVCERAGWGEPLDEGWARGIAVHECYGSVVAQVAEVRIVNGMPHVRRVVCAVDCGIAVAPNQIAAQLEGAVCFGLSAALYGEVTLVDGVVQQTNFDTYRVVRMNEAPRVETHIVRSTAHPTGMGEPGTPPIAPAVANAILALTGKATNRLPFVTS